MIRWFRQWRERRRERAHQLREARAWVNALPDNDPRIPLYVLWRMAEDELTAAYVIGWRP